MYKENKDITLQYYNQNAGSFVSGTVNADLTDTLNRFLSRLKPERQFLILAAVPAEIPNIFWNMDIRWRP